MALQTALDRRRNGRYHVVLGPEARCSVHRASRRRAGRAGLPPRSSGWCSRRTTRRSRSASTSTGWRPRRARTASPCAAIESWATEPAFVEFIADDLRAKLATMPARDTRCCSPPTRCPQRILERRRPLPGRAPGHRRVRRRGSRARRAGDSPGRAPGRTPEPWLGPDILQVIDELANDGHTRAVLVSAVGFVADHLEVLYDLDIEAAGAPTRSGLGFARTACVNDDADGDGRAGRTE